MQHCDHPPPEVEETPEQAEDAPKKSLGQKLLDLLLGREELKDEGPQDEGSSMNLSKTMGKSIIMKRIKNCFFFIFDFLMTSEEIKFFYMCLLNIREGSSQTFFLFH